LQAKLMDFGIARPSSEEEMTALTQEGGGPGTPLYMAPEQIDPRTFGEIGPATDVYAMGVMLYQLVSGRAPYSGSITEIFNGHLNQAAPPLDVSGDPTVPKALTDIIECAMSKRPEQRFPSAKAFRDELVRLQLNAPAETLGATVAAAGLDPNRTVMDTGAGAPNATRVATGDAAAPAGTLLATGPAQSGGKRGMVLAVVALAVVVVVVAALGAAALFLTGGGDAPGPGDEPAPADAAAPVENPADEPVESASQPGGPGTRPEPAVLPSAMAPPEPDGPVTGAEPEDDGPSAMDAFRRAREQARQNEPPAPAVSAPKPKPPEPEPVVAKEPAPEPDGPVSQPEPKPEPKPQPPPPPPEPEPEPEDDDPFAGFKVESRTERKVD
jgi:serine/threonine-protein kinase